MVRTLFFGRTKQAEQALPVKGIQHPAQGALGQAGFLSPFLCCLSEQYEEANPFIQTLFGGAIPLLDQVVIIGALASFSFRLGHGLLCHLPLLEAIVTQDGSGVPGVACIGHDECPDMYRMGRGLYGVMAYVLSRSGVFRCQPPHSKG